MENIVLFLFSVCSWDRMSDTQSNKTNNSVHPNYPTLSMSGTSRSLFGKGGWCHVNTIGGLSDLIPDPICVFTTRRMQSRGPDHLRVLSLDLIPRLTQGENSGTFSPQLWFREEIPLNVCQDEVKTVPRTLEIIVISSGVVPNKNTACLTEPHLGFHWAVLASWIPNNGSRVAHSGHQECLREQSCFAEWGYVTLTSAFLPFKLKWKWQLDSSPLSHTKERWQEGKAKAVLRAKVPTSWEPDWKSAFERTRQMSDGGLRQKKEKRKERGGGWPVGEIHGKQEKLQHDRNQMCRPLQHTKRRK